MIKKRKKFPTQAIEKILLFIERTLVKRLTPEEMVFLKEKMYSFLKEFSTFKYDVIMNEELLKKHIKVVDESAIRATIAKNDVPKPFIHKQRTVPDDIKQMTNRGFYVLQKGKAQRMDDFRKEHHRRRKDG